MNFLDIPKGSKIFVESVFIKSWSGETLTDQILTFEGIDGTCAKLMHPRSTQPIPVRLWNKLKERPDGSFQIINDEMQL